ncbi:hypothetical protein BDR06DRAFT_1007905 [Suillus hirtellus]|nr:hypothetical protein BDR06DRAFT_1007905 [Suillus hirtellus]
MLLLSQTPIGRNDIVWVWNIIWFAPLNWIKFTMKATVIKKLCQHHKAAQAPTHHSRSDLMEK